MRPFLYNKLKKNSQSHMEERVSSRGSVDSAITLTDGELAEGGSSSFIPSLVSSGFKSNPQVQLDLPLDDGLIHLGGDLPFFFDANNILVRDSTGKRAVLDPREINAVLVEVAQLVIRFDL
jgi:hypothetical protein